MMTLYSCIYDINPHRVNWDIFAERLDYCFEAIWYVRWETDESSPTVIGSIITAPEKETQTSTINELCRQHVLAHTKDKAAVQRHLISSVLHVDEASFTFGDTSKM